MKEYLFWAFLFDFIAFLILTDLMNQKQRPPYVTKDTNKKGETEYTVHVNRLSKRGRFISDFAFVRSSGSVRYRLKFRGELIWGIIILIAVAVCSIVIPIFAGYDFEMDYFRVVMGLFLMAFTGFAFAELKAVLRAYRTLKRYLK